MFVVWPLKSDSIANNLHCSCLKFFYVQTWKDLSSMKFWHFKISNDVFKSTTQLLHLVCKSPQTWFVQIVDNVVSDVFSWIQKKALLLFPLIVGRLQISRPRFKGGFLILVSCFVPFSKSRFNRTRISFLHLSILPSLLLLQELVASTTTKTFKLRFLNFNRQQTRNNYNCRNCFIYGHHNFFLVLKK